MWFDDSYAMKAYSQRRPTSESYSQIPPRTEFDCHYYSMNPSTSRIPIIKNSCVYYTEKTYTLSSNLHYCVLIYLSSSLESLLINNSVLEVGSKICEDWDVKSSYEFYEAFRFFSSIYKFTSHEDLSWISSGPVCHYLRGNEVCFAHASIVKVKVRGRLNLYILECIFAFI